MVLDAKMDNLNETMHISILDGDDALVAIDGHDGVVRESTCTGHRDHSRDAVFAGDDKAVR